MKRIVVLMIILPLLGFYLSRTIRRLTGWQPWIVYGVSVAVIALTLSWFVIARSLTEQINTFWMQALVWTGSILMGLLGAFLIYNLIFDLILWVGLKFRDQKKALVSFERRELFFKSASWAALSLAGVGSAVGLKEALYNVQVFKPKIPIPNLPEGLEEMKVGQISDLHIGLSIGKRYVQTVVDTLMNEKPDIIFVTGDLVDGRPDVLKERWLPLKELQAPLGVFFVLGNHEYYSDAMAWLEVTKEVGFINLINEYKHLEFNGQPFLVGGIPDPSGKDFFAEHAIDVTKAGGAETAPLKIMLSHRPDPAPEVAKQGFHVQFSGHTHAGQFFPFNFVVHMIHKHSQGLSQEGLLQVYVNQGTGYWGPPNRFGIPAEVTLASFVKA